MQYDISEKTRETIWKYLQLILFSIVGSLENKDAFGDTAKLFEAINAEEFKSKLEDTLSQMQHLFNSDFGNNTDENGDNDKQGDGDNNSFEEKKIILLRIYKTLITKHFISNKMINFTI